MVKAKRTIVTQSAIGSMIHKLIDSRTESRELNLLIAVLAQAIADTRELTDTRDRRSARRYFSQNQHAHLCDLIGIEPERGARWVSRITT